MKNFVFIKWHESHRPQICIVCVQVVENEKHFLLECPLYTDQRTILLQVCHTNIENFTNMNQEDRFVEIMKKKTIKLLLYWENIYTIV